MSDDFFTYNGIQLPKQEQDAKTEKKSKPIASDLPENLGKAWKDCKMPDFNDPNRPKTCLEVDFPITQINELASLEASLDLTHNSYLLD